VIGIVVDLSMQPPLLVVLLDGPAEVHPALVLELAAGLGIEGMEIIRGAFLVAGHESLPGRDGSSSMAAGA
jgi:hypothetical protein